MTDKRSERLRQKRQLRRSRVATPDVQTSGWACGIGSCSYLADTAMDLIDHQTSDHPPHTCKVCSRDVPDGFIAIYHAFEEHGRTEYVKAYDASPGDVRQREEVKAAIEHQIDVPALLHEITEENEAF